MNLLNSILAKETMLEIYQKNRIEFIKEILPLFSDNFILKGGTALSLFYGLNRYSEDLDFDCISQNMNFINSLKAHKDFKQWKINIKKDTEFVFRAMIDYGAISHLGSYPLKIEVSGRERNRLRLLRNKNVFYQKIDGINVYNIDRLITMKVNAFSGRDKSRDLFDICFLFEHYPQFFDIAQLESIATKIYYFGEEELDLLLLDEIHTHRLISCGAVKIGFSSAFLQKVQNRLNELENQLMNENIEPISKSINRKYR